MADTKIKLVLGMLFLTFSSVNIWFAKGELVWKTYSIIEVLSTMQKIEIINKKELATVPQKVYDKAL